MTAEYAGRWLITRSIDDAHAHTSIACDGYATLTDIRGALRYDEYVALRLAGRDVLATRTYFYRRAGSTLSVTFADGRPFFTADIGADGTATAMHPCGLDLYTGRLAFRADDWETRWNITGGKALTIVTRYMRAGD